MLGLAGRVPAGGDPRRSGPGGDAERDRRRRHAPRRRRVWRRGGGTCPHRGGQIGDGRMRRQRDLPAARLGLRPPDGLSPFNPGRLAAHLSRPACRDGAVEIDAEQVAPGAPARPSVYLGRLDTRGATDRGMYLVHHLAEAAAVRGGDGSERNEPGMHARPYPSYDELVFRPAQLDRLPLLGDDPVDTSVVLGTRARKPLALDIPLFVSHMSYGALSPEAKEALARGAPRPARRSPAARAEPTRASATTPSATSSRWPRATSAGPRRTSPGDAIEVKIGQGAKPGLGGTLLGSRSPPRSPPCGACRREPTCTRRALPRHPLARPTWPAASPRSRS